MSKFGKIYRENIYGVITTLTFHIIVLIVLLTSNLKSPKPITDDSIIIDFSKPEIQLPEPAKKETPEQLTNNQRSQLSGRDQHFSNRAVNDAAKTTSRSKDPFFDKAYDKEIEAAKKLVNDVNKNLARKIPEIGDIKMPEDNTNGKTRQEVEQSNFKGKSNIHYTLTNRFHSRLPIPVYLAEGGGVVIVDIVVARDGHVISANPRVNSKIADMTIFAYAKQAAEKTWFNEDLSAPERQQGTITYTFMAQ